MSQSPLPRCPLCAKGVRIEPDGSTGNVECPLCGEALWFVSVRGELRLYPRWQVSARKREVIEVIASAGMDALDVADVVTELEEMGLFLPEEDVEKLDSAGDLIDYIIREVPE